MSSLRMWIFTVLLLMAAGSQAYSGPMFESPVVYSLSQEAKTVAVGDLNGDGRDDVAITAWPSALYVLYQQLDGTLGPPVELYSPIMPLGLAIGDLNRDSRMDLAVGGDGGEIFLYRQQYDGTLGLPGMCFGYGLVNSLVIDDLNGDGLADIANTSFTIPGVDVSLQNSNYTFGLPFSYSVRGFNSRSICTLDYNSDNVRDIAFLLDNEVCYLAGSTGGGFMEPLYIPASWAYALAAGDVTGDGRDDLVFTVPDSLGYGVVGVISQTSVGLPASVQLYPTYAYAQALALADLNEDGGNDVVTAHSGYEAVSVLSQNTDGTLADWVNYSVPYNNEYQCGALAVGDLNSDGTPDLAIADMWHGLVVLLHTPNPDTTAPNCTAVASGTMGLNGWYISSVTMKLTAEDELGGSGLKEILITRDGTTWIPYSEPLVLGEEGTTSIGYCAEDNAGNRSQVQWMSVKLDTTPPALTVQPLVTTIWPPNGSVVDVPVNVNARDVTSGVAGLHLAVKDEYGLVQPEVDAVSGFTVTVPLVASRDDGDADGRVYTIILTGTDKAGNTAEVASTVTIPCSAPRKPKKAK